ncbi:hypothetical protein Mal15_28150 [Stieleria maiorica]|uniref:Uncharacterized protein n=1 Tax=Stieleria maiorica TaxID=2795974 RepID=A0A5B9MFH1_9BACT|nr:hypothetical protein [Stieleria maiorica]QEF98760.1 hypothetical protein Mal15_28150 [Stieleria maiorica]
MDFWDQLFDNEYKRRADIEKLKRTVHARRMARRHTADQIDSQEKRIEKLEDQVGELALLCRSLLTILRENGGVDPQRLQEIMTEMDAEDGVVDGKITDPSPPDEPPDVPEIRAW